MKKKNKIAGLIVTYLPNDFEIENVYKTSRLVDVLYVVDNSCDKIYRNKIYDLYKCINVLGIFIILQIFLGILTILNGAQIYIASMHQISSIFLVSSCVYFLFINTKFN